MARLPYVTSSDDPQVLSLIGRIKQERDGRLINLYKVLLNSPAVAEGWLNLLTAVRQKSSLPARYRELVILRIAVLNGAPYELVQHVPHALAAGLTEEEIEAVQTALPGEPLTGTDLAVLSLADAMTREIRVPEAVFQRAADTFEVRQLTELTVTIAAYNMVSRFLEAVLVDHD
jgi:AhpD family alkylhydroperoxidase